jgi:DNA invertase Pin-like site-specific DNA recombinase
MGQRTLPARAWKRGALIRVVIYLRVSTEEQVKGFGLKAQEVLCRKWLDFKFGKGNYVIVGIFSDDGVSGKLDSRPEYDEMNAVIQSKGCDLVLFGKLDRIGRTMKEIHRWTYDTTDLGIRVATADSRIDSEDELFEVVLSLLAYMAQLEHALILERTAQGREQKLIAGGWPLGAPPYGVALEGKGKNAVPVNSDYECEQWEQVYICRVLDGMNWPETADKLNLLEYVTRSGKPWTGDNAANRFSKSTVLDGYAEFRISCDVDDEDEDAEPYKVYRISVPKPLSDEKCEALKENFAGSARQKSAHRSYHLSGRIAAQCGGHYTGYTRTDTGVSYYKCAGTRMGLKCRCSEIPAADIEGVVWREMESILSDTGRFRELVSDWMGFTPQRIASYERRIAQIDEKLERLGDTKKERMLSLLEKLADAGDEDIDLETLKGLKADLKDQNKEEAKKLRDEKERVQEWLDDARSQVERAQEIMAAIDEMAFSVERATWEQKSDLLKLLDIEVTVTGAAMSHRKGVADPLTEWHRSSKRMVPARVVDEDWATVEGLLPGARQKGVSAREAFEAILYKLRTAEKWSALIPSEGSWNSIYRRAKAWHASGAWEAALDALGAYEGVAVPELYTLPPMQITGCVDPRYTTAHLRACSHDNAPCPSCNETSARVQEARIQLARVSQVSLRPDTVSSLG